MKHVVFRLRASSGFWNFRFIEFAISMISFYGATIDNLSCLTPFLVTNA